MLNTMYTPLKTQVVPALGGKTVWTGEVEPFGRMTGMAGIIVDMGKSYIKAKFRVYNRTAFPRCENFHFERYRVESPEGDIIAVYDTSFVRRGSLTVERYEDSRVYYSVCEGKEEVGDMVANTFYNAEILVECCEVRNTREERFCCKLKT